MKNQKMIIRFDEVSQSEKYSLRRVQGTATSDSIIKLIDIADLHANPREAKVGDVTDAIQESLEKTPQWFQFKSKGMLLASASCVPLERNRFELSFDDEDVEGVLDGGHNLLAIALHFLKRVLGESADKELRGVKRWELISDCWKRSRDKIEEMKSGFGFLTQVEVLFPQEGAPGRDEFQDAILHVARARNNNAQLTEETKANKAGFYDTIKAAIDPKLQGEIEWKTNDGGRIKVRDLVALALIPLSKIPKLPGVDGFNPTAIYNSKSDCVSAFNELMESDAITARVKGDIRELRDDGVKSALALLKDLPRLYDEIYAQFPEAYNASSPGFGRISGVYVWESGKTRTKGDPKYLARAPKTKFYRDECKYDYPDGFIMPFVWALREVMEYKNGVVTWKTPPSKFLRENLTKSLEVYHGMISLAGYDPQKIGKTSSSYSLASNDFKSRL